MRRAVGVSSILAASWFAFALAGCEEPVPPRPRSPRPVVAIELEWTDPGVELELTGVVEPWNVEDIAFEVGGRLDYVVEAGTLLEGRWEEGSEIIQTGDVLARLDPVPFETALRVAEADVEATRVRSERVLPAQLRAADAQLVQEEQEYERMVEAEKTSAVSKLDVIRAKAGLDSAKASKDQLEAEIASAGASLERAEASAEQRRLDLENAQLFAPFDGEVSETYVRAGGYVGPGEPVARLVTMNPVLIELAVSAETNRLIGLDNAAQLFLEGRHIEQRGKVYQKSTVADPELRTFSVKVIARNLRLPVHMPADPAVLDLPRVQTLMPLIRLDPNDQGPLYVEESGVGEDAEGTFVWAARGVVADRDISPEDPSFIVEKVRVALGQRRMNFQKVFTFRELVDAGELGYFDLVALGLPEGVADGDRVAQIHESWQLNPGDLLTVRLGRDQGQPGFYVPMEAIALDSESRTSVFVILEGEGGARVHRVPVEVGVAVGTDQRISSDALEPGMRIALRGAAYLVDGEQVIVTR